MPVRRKPSAPKNVDEFIHGAGADKSKANGEPIVPVKLRISESLLAQVDAAVNQRRPVPSRHQWLLEAIYHNLERENTGQ